MQWRRNPNQSNVDNLNNVRRKANGHFRKEEKEYMKAKFEELETNSKIKNIRDLYRGISGFNTLQRTGDADLWFYVTTLQDG